MNMEQPHVVTKTEYNRSKRRLQDLRRCRYPNTPVRSKLITSDKRWIIDPFTGNKRRMLRRYFLAVYGMTIEDVRKFFGLTEKQLPASAPGYRQEKSQYARFMKLGTNRNKAGKPAPSRRKWTNVRTEMGFRPVMYA
jgi:predicted transcriptional regulator